MQRPRLPAEMPDRARVVVIGGGVVGCSVAYHLARSGCADVLLLERDRLTSGTTWHAAGLMVTFGSLSATSTELRRYTRELYAGLERETGVATGFNPVGFVELATEPDRLEEYRRVAAFNRHCGVDVAEISAREVASLFPIARTDDVLAGFYVAGDGRVNPVDVTMALAAGAKAAGANLLEGVTVTGVRSRRGAVTAVVTTAGEIETEAVVNCAGMWARQLGERSGVTIPLQAAEHYYLITEPIPGMSGAWPVLEDPASFGYYREETGGLMIGLFEPESAPWNVDGVPEDFSFGSIPPDWERMGRFVERAMRRVPVAAETGIRTFFCGPESFTADLQPIVGEAPEVRNYFVAAGMNSIGILTGGGIGRVVAHWILEGRPDVDVTAMNIDRLHRFQNTAEYRRARTAESLGLVYRCHYPTRTMRSARNIRHSPLHDRLVGRGAVFRDVSGWEMPDWYDVDGSGPPEEWSWGRQPWFDRWRAEHDAIRTGVGVMDMSFMSKFLVQGRHAGVLLERLSANRVDGPTGRITYTPWLNEAGTLEADLTVAKLADDRFWVIASDTAHRHVEAWMRRHVEDLSVTVTDVTAAYAQINVHGPEARRLLGRFADVDLSSEAFPFRGVRRASIGAADVWLIRIGYVGEFGYEIYVPTDQATHVYDRIMSATDGPRPVPAGLKALASLRMEKGYRDYGHDIDNTDTVDEAGLGFAVDLSKDFVGRRAVVVRREAGPPRRRLAQIILSDPEPLMWHGEVVYRNGVAAGYVRAASYGYTLGGAVGLAMIEADEPVSQDYLEAGAWEVDVAGVRFPAAASLRPLYDPRSKRVTV